MNLTLPAGQLESVNHVKAAQLRLKEEKLAIPSLSIEGLKMGLVTPTCEKKKGPIIQTANAVPIHSIVTE